MRLVYKVSQREVAVGDIVPLHPRAGRVVGITKPHHPASTGRVQLHNQSGAEVEYYPSVIGAEWIEREYRVKPAPVADQFADLKAAHAAGKTIQYLHGRTGKWTDAIPLWDDSTQYRVKPANVVRFTPVLRMPAGGIYMPESKTNGTDARSSDFNGQRQGDTLVGILRIEINPDTLELVSATMEKP